MSAPHRPLVDVLIPTCDRAAALAVTLTSLCAQRFLDFRVVISDQSTQGTPFARGEVQAALRVLQAHGHPIALHQHLPRRGMAEHRQFLLDQARGELALCIDDDVILEPDLLARLVSVLGAERCGFVGSAVIGLSHIDDVRPAEQGIELWEGPVQPETVRPGSGAWERHKLHNAANLLHVQRALAIEGDASLRYRVAWVGGCVLYDVGKLRACGGFQFWRALPTEHCGEDVLAQLRVMARFGGCGVLPSGAYHQELPTTVRDRRVNAPEVLDPDVLDPDVLDPNAAT